MSDTDKAAPDVAPVVKRKRQRARNKKTDMTTYTSVPLPPCKVCEGEATGYHFGVITCEACKAFFRRALIHNQVYQCIRNNDCDVTGKSHCSACRLQKCFNLGMSKGGVRRGRYTVAIRTKSILEARASEGKSPPVSKPMTPPGQETSINHVNNSMDVPLDLSPSSTGSQRSPECVSRTESNVLQSNRNSTNSSSRLTNLTNENHDAISNVAPPQVDTSKSFARSMELSVIIDNIVSCQDAVYPNLRKINDLKPMQYQSYSEFKEKQKIFGDLFGQSQSVSTKEYQQIFAETGIDVDDRLSQFNKKGSIMEHNIEQYVTFVKLVPGIKGINAKDVSKLIKAAHMEFWVFGNYMLFNKELEIAVSWDGSHNNTKANILKFFNKEWVDKMFVFSDNLQKLDLSIEEIAIIRAITLTFTDRCPLEDREKIGALQETFMECLRFLISKTHPDPGKRLYKIMDRLLAIRDMTHANMDANRKFLNEWAFVINDYPLWKEMLSFDEI